MVVDLEIQHSGHLTSNVLDPWIAELQHFATMLTDQMVMLFEGIGFFELCKVLTELMFTHQIAG